MNNGTFRKELPFVLDEKAAGSSAIAFLGQDQMRVLNQGDTIILGYVVYGGAFSNEIYLGDPRRDAQDPLQKGLEAYNRIIVQNKIDHVGIIVCRLCIEKEDP